MAYIGEVYGHRHPVSCLQFYKKHLLNEAWMKAVTLFNAGQLKGVEAVRGVSAWWGGASMEKFTLSTVVMTHKSFAHAGRLKGVEAVRGAANHVLGWQGRWVWPTWNGIIWSGLGGSTLAP
jgi:hypothetical protein